MFARVASCGGRPRRARGQSGRADADQALCTCLWYSQRHPIRRPQQHRAARCSEHAGKRLLDGQATPCKATLDRHVSVDQGREGGGGGSRAESGRTDLSWCARRHAAIASRICLVVSAPAPDWLAHACLICGSGGGCAGRVCWMLTAKRHGWCVHDHVDDQSRLTIDQDGPAGPGAWCPAPGCQRATRQQC